MRWTTSESHIRQHDTFTETLERSLRFEKRSLTRHFDDDTQECSRLRYELSYRSVSHHAEGDEESRLTISYFTPAPNFVKSPHVFSTNGPR